jgi:hypothetical protein
VKRSHRNDPSGKTGQGHQHGVVDPKIASTDSGKWAVKWSFAALMVKALLTSETY